MENDVRELRAEVKEIREATVEHRIRLETGTKAFEAMRDKDESLAGSIKAVQDAIAPKKPNYFGIIALTFTLIMGLVSALWGLSLLFSSRPTTEQIDKIMDKHEAHPHPNVQKQINELRSGQLADQKIHTEQKKAIEQVTKATDKKLDKLLKRKAPAPRRRPPR
jgi:hypothetical protein